MPSKLVIPQEINSLPSNMFSQPKKVLNRYEIRQPYESESLYFKMNPKVSGMASEDNRIVLNPYSQLSQSESDAVAKNEGIRLYLRENQINPDFEVTENQKQYFNNTPYSDDDLAVRHTILARILSGDPSIKEVTPRQRIWADWIAKNLER
jgi:hypothetical protein